MKVKILFLHTRLTLKYSIAHDPIQSDNLYNNTVHGQYDKSQGNAYFDVSCYFPY